MTTATQSNSFVVLAAEMVAALRKADEFFSMSPRERDAAEDRANEATGGNVGYEEVVWDAVHTALAKVEGLAP